MIQRFSGQFSRSLGNRAFVLALAGAIASAFAVLAIYWPAAHNGFVWDDWAVVVQMSRSIASVSWLEAILRPPADYAVLFRPLTMLTFLLQLSWGHAGPLSFHVVNIIIHLTTVVWLTLLAWRVLDGDATHATARPALAVLCGLTYGVHPVLTEPVIWISARSDLLLTSFLGLALLLDRTLPATGWNRAVAVGGLFLASLLCKETAIGFLVALPLVHLALDRPRPLWRWAELAGALAPHYRIYVAVAGACILYVGLRVVAGRGLDMGDAESPAQYIETFGQHVLVVITSLAVHIWSALWPFESIAPGRHLPLPIDVAKVLLPIVASTVSVLLALVGARSSGPWRVPALLFLAFVASLLPVANIVPIPAVAVPTEIGVASRYVTFPLLFACLALPFALRSAGASFVRPTRYGRLLLWLVVGAWTLASVANIRVTIPLWKNDAIMNSWAIQQDGPSFWRYANYGVHYVRTGDLRHAREAFIAAVTLRDDQHSAWVWDNIGIVDIRLGDTGRAIPAFRRALELDPRNVAVYYRLGMTQHAVGELKAAAQTLEAGVNEVRTSGRPHEKEGWLHYELGMTYRDLGRADDAVAHLKLAVQQARSPDERNEFETALKSIAPEN